jgi:ankyrin repeat protein
MWAMDVLPLKSFAAPLLSRDLVDLTPPTQTRQGLHARLTMQMLMDAEADVNAQGGYYGNALLATLVNGHAKMVQMLRDPGAEMNAQGADCSIILQAASVHGHAKVVQILMDAGADANAQDGEYGNAPAAASRGGHERVVQMLIGAGAVNRKDSIGDDKALVSDRLTIHA